MDKRLETIFSFIRSSQWFWRKVEIGEYHECWPYLGGISAKGYGRVHFVRTHPSIVWDAHRVAFYTSRCETEHILELADYHLKGKRERMVVHHRCENGACCNPFHLQLVEHGQNIKAGWAHNSNSPILGVQDLEWSLERAVDEAIDIQLDVVYLSTLKKVIHISSTDLSPIQQI